MNTNKGRPEHFLQQDYMLFWGRNVKQLEFMCATVHAMEG